MIAPASRRSIVLAAGALAATALARPRPLFAQASAGGSVPAAGGPFTLPPLPYDFGALEPHIDAETMALHHGKHHQAYVSNLNKALADHGDLAKAPLPDLLRRLDQLPESARTAVRNNGGGHANHSMFWSIMGPGKGELGGGPQGPLAEAVERDLGGLDALKKAVNEAGARQFGSGWVFVTVEPKTGKLEIVSMPNQDSPLMSGRPVLMGNDLWEHAYYLKYRNRRADYLNAWWNVVNWQEVGRRYGEIRKGAVPV